MGEKEAYAQKIEAELNRFGFDIEDLKKTVDRMGLGDMPEWLNAFLDIRDRIDEIRFHIQYLRHKRNSRVIHIAKLHIAALMAELEEELNKTTKRFGR